MVRLVPRASLPTHSIRVEPWRGSDQTIFRLSMEQVVLRGELGRLFKEMVIKVSASPQGATRAPNAAQQTEPVAKGLRTSVFILCL